MFPNPVRQEVRIQRALSPSQLAAKRRRNPNRLTEPDRNFIVLTSQITGRNTTSNVEGNMTQIGIDLTELFGNRSCRAGLSLLHLFLKTFCFLGAMLLSALIILSTGPVLHAQGQTASAYASPSVSEEQDLPEAPSASPTPKQSPQSSTSFQTPRFSRTMDFGDKFKYLVEPAFGPRSFFTNAFDAGIRLTSPPTHYPPEWRGGAEAFGRLYGDSFARNGAEGIGRFSASVILHEDPRYQRSESTFFPARLGHSLLFSFVDKTDGGHTTVAISNFTGAAAGGFIGNAYLPAGFDNLTHAGQRSSIVFSTIAAQNIAQEFAPELGRFLKKIHLAHIPMPPVWWTANK